MRTLFLVACLLWGLPALAQTPQRIDGSLLGIDETTLQNLFPAAKRLTRPVMGPHGVRGNWRLAQTPLADTLLDTTFFIRTRRVARIEQHGVLAQPTCPAPGPGLALWDELQARYGIGLAASDGLDQAHQSVVWVTQGVDVLLRLTRTPAQCELLLVYQPHLEKDASTL